MRKNKKIKSLLHYTSLANCLSILINKQIYFNLIENSNDALESNKANELDLTNKYYVFCCNNNYFNVLMWLAYAKNISGCSIRFSFKDDYNCSDLFLDNDIESFIVKYVDKKGYESIPKEKFGKYKFKNFKGECEYRFLIKKDKPLSKKEQMRNLNFDCLKSICIRCNEIYYDFMKKIAKAFNAKYGHNFMKIEKMDLLR